MSEIPQAQEHEDPGIDDAPWIPTAIGDIGPIRERMSDIERKVWQAFKMDPDKDVNPSPFMRRGMLEMLLEQHWLPPWQLITHLHPKDDTDSGGLRRKRIRLLIKATKICIRMALREHEADPEKDERSPYWDPMVQVCRELGIAKSALTKYCVEQIGLTATQLCDIVRVEHIRPKMREGLRAELKDYFVKHDALGAGLNRNGTDGKNGSNGSNGSNERWAVYTWLKRQRRRISATANERALALGFSSHSKFYRACVAQFRKTPQQLELELIDELLRERTGETLPADPAAETSEELKAQLKELVPQGHFPEEVLKFRPKLD